MKKTRTASHAGLTPDQIAEREKTTRLVRERIAYHERMSELLGEREREQARIAELERAQRPA